jgi:cellulose synthase/poly-beta-1,6-N-acetylglucosamine synthase-like glycosyltransferase
MLIEFYIFACIIVLYGLLITISIIGFGKLKRVIKEVQCQESEFISIIISARNEAKHIEECIFEIGKQNFPKNKYELILIDDASEDTTYDLAYNSLIESGLTYQIIKQPEHKGKKHNLSQAIELAKGSIIITSDADVLYRHQNWLASISNYFKANSPNMLIMPIDYQTQSGLLSSFQIIENIALTGVTAGFTGIQKPFMCNGANLAFKKWAFENIAGYQSHLHISSGEDVFLMEDLKKNDPKSIHYVLIRELIVKTAPVNSLTELLNQRIRWAYKSKNNPNNLNLFAGFVIVAANLLVLALFVAILKKSVIIPYLSIFVLAKFVFDFLLLFLASDFLGRTKYIWWLLPFECVYWIYALVVGTISLFIKPYWKGKKIN